MKRALPLFCLYPVSVLAVQAMVLSAAVLPTLFTCAAVAGEPKGGAMPAPVTTSDGVRLVAWRLPAASPAVPDRVSVSAKNAPAPRPGGGLLALRSARDSVLIGLEFLAAPFDGGSRREPAQMSWPDESGDARNRFPLADALSLQLKF